MKINSDFILLYSVEKKKCQSYIYICDNKVIRIYDCLLVPGQKRSSYVFKGRIHYIVIICITVCLKTTA